MSRHLLIQTCILLAVTAHVRTQYIDFFNSFLQPFTTTKPRNDATKRPDTKHRQTNKQKYQDVIFFETDDFLKPREKPKTADPFVFYTTTTKPKRKSKTTTSQNNAFTTLKPIKPVNSNKIINNNHGAIRSISNNNRETINNNVNDKMINYVRKIDNYNTYDNGFNDFTTKSTNNWQTTQRTTEYYNNRQTTNYYDTRTTRKQFDNTRRTTNFYDRTTSRFNNNNSDYTTTNPLLHRPGVKPAVVDENRPPITNRPLTYTDTPFNTYRPIKPVNTRPVFETERPKPAVHRPISSGVVRPVTGVNRPVSPVNKPATDDETGIEIEIGPDEDEMSDAEKRRLYDICEQKCDEYKSARVKKVVALPLAPISQGVEVNVSSCAPANIPLIIGGEVARIQQFPHMALVGWKNLQSGGYSWKCGGSLVSAQFVVTAGHCTYHDKDNNVLRYDADGPPQAVQLGSAVYNDRLATVVQISQIIRHPKYKLRRSYFDVALIKLATTVSFSDRISPACLGVPPAVGQPVIATGWGKTEYGGDSSIELRSVSINIWDMAECREIWGTSLKLPNGPKPNSQVCAGDRGGGKDTCQGDSGGPAQVQEGCAWRVVAVTSVGRSCGAPGTPALYATLPRAFIASQIYTDVKPGRDGNNQYGNSGATGSSNWNTGNNNNNNRGNENNNNNNGFGNNNDQLGNRGVANIRPVQNNNGQGYDNGRGQNNNGQSYDNNGRVPNNNGQSYDNSGRGQSNNGQYYGDSQGSSSVSSGLANNWNNNNANTFGNNQNTRDNNDWSAQTETTVNNRYDQNNRNVYGQNNYGNYRTTTTTVGYNQNYGQNNYNNANSYGQTGYNNQQSPPNSYGTAYNDNGSANTNNNGYNNNYSVVNRPWWTK